MKILWVSPGFLHPTTRGGQIRTLKILRRLRTLHEIHFVGLHGGSVEPLERSPEYCSRAWPVPHTLARRDSLRFWIQTAEAVFSKMPVVVARKRSPGARALVEKLLLEQTFDRVVCDFVTPTIYLPRDQPCVLFEHNVEIVLWHRYAERATNPATRAFFHHQANRISEFEQTACRRAKRVITVSEVDAAYIRERWRISHVSTIPTGVDAEYFTRRAEEHSNLTSRWESDLLFLGSMDWMPNIDGVRWFVKEMLPIIRNRMPNCSLVVAGRHPTLAVRRMSERDSRIRVTGTVADVRPYLWGAKLSIVPLRIGGGTRLKIYEAMAAGIPVVSTSIGAEGLEVSHPQNIRISNTPQTFADACIELLQNRREYESQVSAAAALVRGRFTWEAAADRFNAILAGTTNGPARPHLHT